jgi:dipeptide transport system permease protein
VTRGRHRSGPAPDGARPHGAQPPLPEWGALLTSARVYLTRAPWLVDFPGLAILITVLGLNLLGYALRDVLDPRLK